MFYIIQILTWIFCRLIFGLFLKLRIFGLEKIKNLNSGGVIFVANHGGKLDSFLIGSSLPIKYFNKMKRLRYIAHPKYSDNIYYGWILKVLGAYSIYGGDGNYEKSLAKTVEVLKNNESVVMFPTGRIEPEFIPANARPGIGYLAKTLDPLIVPVFVANSNKITIKEFILGLRPVQVIFGAPFKLADVSGDRDDLKGNAKLIMEKVLALRPETEAVGVEAERLHV